MENICIPIHVDAFALSPDCCSGQSTIAPYTQPNYVSLRLESHLIQHDVRDDVDFHLATNPKKNPRIADIANARGGGFKTYRLGIHLHWTLPRLYRTATSTAQGGQSPQASKSSSDASQPSFRAFPNRWLVIRHLKSCQPANVLPAYQAWVIESDCWQKITEIQDDDLDLESDVAPFVTYDGDPTSAKALKTQSEVFLGKKYNLSDWKEDTLRHHIKPLTVMNSSNPLFPDFALDNTNVLSMIDNFKYMKNNSVNYCTQASADYYVIGWHAESAEDPMQFPRKSTVQETLTKLMLKLDVGSDSTPDTRAQADNISISDTDRSARCVCHGAIYDVKYNQRQKPRSLADEAAAKFTSNFKMEPLSIGTTVLDGIMTFLEAHKASTDTILGQGTTNLANDLLEISTLLYATADEYDARVQAQDLIAQQNYKRTDGGAEWIFNQQTKPGSAPATPSTDQIAQLKKLNEAQTKLDAYTKKLSYTQWDLFAEWWKFVSDFVPPEQQNDRYPPIKEKVKQIKQACTDLANARSALLDPKNANSIPALQKTVACAKSSKSHFHNRSDPSLCIAGLASGFPEDFMDLLKVTEDHQHEKDVDTAKAMFKDDKGSDLSTPFPSEIKDTAMKILSEYSKRNGESNMVLTTGSQTWGDRNPFIPLFVEWQGVYYHIDNDRHDAWDVQVRPSPVGHPNPQVRYGPKALLATDQSVQRDTRTVGGRILILPQPAFSLEAVVMQVLDNAAVDLDDSKKAEIRDNIRKLNFISAPLSGLTSHLLTRCEGAHVKPNVRVQGQTVVPLQVAVDAASGIEMGTDGLIMIDAESARTPYGSLLEFNTDQIPFKPVTQGQMILTKLNIIDKFGQAICVPLPKPRLKKPLTAPSANIYPCLSDYLAPDIRNKKVNTIYDLPGPSVDPGQWPLSQYLQLTPAINQEARINADWVIRDMTLGSTTPWRHTNTDYESPVFGWIIINYADNGLQFFLKDGTFYQEVRKGGAFGTNLSAKYIPFKPPQLPVTDAANVQLDALISLFSPAKDPQGKYLQTFFDMINSAIKTMPFPPSSYAGYASAIVGKPLALVNFGLSLELATPALTAQNSLGKTFFDTNTKYKDIITAYQSNLSKYTFPIKIGDASRTFDGVVGYYDTLNNSSPPSTTDMTQWSTLYTYFGLPPTADPVQTPNPAPLPSSPVQPIAPSTFPSLSPHYIDPETTPDMAAAAAARLIVKTVLMDPYTTLHAYSPILPTATLRLPDWAVQTAFERMSAFFRLGPSLLVRDVPATYAVATKPPPPAVPGKPDPPLPSVTLPMSGKKGTWKWLQPYAQSDAQSDAQFASLEVDQDHGTGKFAKGPYTFVEGYLQLVGNLGKEDAKNLV